MRTKATLVIGAFIVSSSIAFANIGTIGISNVSGARDSANEFIGPYGGPFNGVTTMVFCDDLNHNIWIGAAPTTVNVSSIGNLSLTRFGGPNAPTALVATADYEQIFYLSTFLATPNLQNPYPTFTSGTNSANSNVQADIQDAMWSYFAPSTENIGTNQVNYWVTKAGANYRNYDYSTFKILTDSSDQYGGIQELFINTDLHGDVLTPTPEPGFWGLLTAGAGTLGVCLYRRKRAV